MIWNTITTMEVEQFPLHKMALLWIVSPKIAPLYTIGQLGKIQKQGFRLCDILWVPNNKTSEISIEHKKVILSPTYLLNQFVALLDVSTYHRTYMIAMLKTFSTFTHLSLSHSLVPKWGFDP